MASFFRIFQRATGNRLKSTTTSTNTTNSTSSSNATSSTGEGGKHSFIAKYGGLKGASIVMLVFALTGTTSMRLTRPTLSNVLGMEGSWSQGPWSWRFAYFFVTMPIYSALLISYGYLFGRGPLFKDIALRPYIWLWQQQSRLFRSTSKSK